MTPSQTLITTEPAPETPVAAVRTAPLKSIGGMNAESGKGNSTNNLLKAALLGEVCEECGGEGVIFNNGDPNSGQAVVCQCLKAFVKEVGNKWD